METKTKRLEVLQKKLGTSAKTIKGLMAALIKIAAKSVSIPIYARGEKKARRDWDFNYKEIKFIRGRHPLSDIRPDRAYTESALLKYDNKKKPLVDISHEYDGTYGKGDYPIKRYRYIFVLHPSVKGKEIIGGLVTAKLDPTHITGVQKCQWFDLGYNSQKLVNGFLVRGHYHSKRKTAKLALAEYKGAQAKKVSAYLASRARRIDPYHYLNLWVTKSDSIAGGNSPSWTDNFITKFLSDMAKTFGWGTIGAVRVGLLLNYQDNVYTQRAVHSATVKSVLIGAVCKGNPERVKLLINAGANVNLKDNGGNSALSLAARKGHTEIVELLKEAGAK